MAENSLVRYPDAAAVNKKLDALIKLPVYSLSAEALRRYETDYFEKKCPRSKAA